MTTPTTRDLIDAICRNVAGAPAAAMDWRQLLVVREQVDRMLTAEVNRRQADAAIAATGGRRDRTGEVVDPDTHPPEPHTAAREHLTRTLGWPK